MISSEPYSSTPAKLSLILGLVILAIIILFTLVSLAFMLTGNIAALENSRAPNLAYILLSVCGEGMAMIGLVAGAYALLKRRPSGYKAPLGVALNLVGLVLFCPVAIALSFNGLAGLLDNFIR